MANASILTVGCPSNHGGQIITGDPTMKIDGKPVARIGDLHSCPQFYPTIPPIPHAVTPIIRTANIPIRGTVNLREFAYEGDTTACGAQLLKCSTNAYGTALLVGAGLLLLSLPFFFMRRNKSSSSKHTDPKAQATKQAEQINNQVKGMTDFINRNLNPEQAVKVQESKDPTCGCDEDMKK